MIYTRGIVLLGLPGVGKTSTGRQLARQLDWDFVDIDELLGAEGHDIVSMLESGKEVEFRMLEAAAVRRVLAEKDEVVVAPGSGWAAWRNNLSDLDPGVTTVYLKARLETVLGRLTDSVDRRPLLDGNTAERLSALAGERERFFRRASFTVTSDDQEVAEVATRIINKLQEISADQP